MLSLNDYVNAIQHGADGAKFKDFFNFSKVYLERDLESGIEKSTGIYSQTLQLSSVSKKKT